VEWTGANAPTVTVTTDAQNNRTTILVDGVAQAIINGTSTLTAADVQLVRAS
jgi:hypothetical protein